MYLDHYGDSSEVGESYLSVWIWWTRSAETPVGCCCTNSERPPGSNKVHACGVNPVDAYIRSCTHSIKPLLPYTPSWDVAGIVEACWRECICLQERWHSLPGRSLGATPVCSGSPSHCLHTSPKNWTLNKELPSASRALMLNWRSAPQCPWKLEEVF